MSWWYNSSVRVVARFRRMAWWKQGLIALAGLVILAGGAVLLFIAYSQRQSNSSAYIHRWFDDPRSRPDLSTSRRDPCPGAPFLLPSDGLIGLLWRDSAAPYNILRRHTGLDIFGDGAPGTVPVVAAYDGYLTRQSDWKSTVIIRHADPLQPGRTIWTYYTHMASRDGAASFVSADFPPGISDVWVEQGTLLGYQGEYSGDSLFPIGQHVHFSIVKSNPDGSFLNETRIGNTLDPSPYLGMDVNIKGKPARPIRCHAGS